VTRFDTFWQYADWWQRSAFIAIMVAAVAQTGFVVVYMLRPWWRHYVGRALLVKSASLLIVLWLTIVNTFVRYPGQRQVSSLALWLVAGAIIYQLVALLRTRRHVYPPDDRHDALL
jgi:putative copper export protein